MKQEDLFSKEEPITNFRGEFAYLSNFWPAEVIMDGELYSTVEHAYQAAKTHVKSEQEKIRKAVFANEAKVLGGKVTLRPDWEEVKVFVMERLLAQKFLDPAFKKKLLDTGTKELVEGNYWHDNFWGQCTCPKHIGKGRNELGNLLMSIRETIKQLECASYVLQEFSKNV